MVLEDVTEDPLPLFDDAGPLFNCDKLQAVNGTTARTSRAFFKLEFNVDLVTSSKLRGELLCIEQRVGERREALLDQRVLCDRSVRV